MNNLVYEGKGKKLYCDGNPKYFIQEFKNDLTAFNGKKKSFSENKGMLYNNISTLIFKYLEENEVDTHFIKQLNDNQMLVKKLRMIPLEVVMRNYVSGSLTKRLNLKEGYELDFPILEFYYKNDDLNDPLINDYHIEALYIINEDQFDQIKLIAHQINKYLIKLFKQINIKLVDFKIEFGTPYNDTNIILGDSIDPDSMRLWNINNDDVKYDKDNFRFDLDDIEIKYQEIYNKLLNVLKYDEINNDENKLK